MTRDYLGKGLIATRLKSSSWGVPKSYMNRKHLRLLLSLLWCIAVWALSGEGVAEPSASPWMSASPVGRCDPDESRGCTYNLPAGYQFTATALRPVSNWTMAM